MEADLQFVMATGPGRDTWRYHPLLAEMLRAELQTHRPAEAQELNRLAAGILQARGDVADAAPCLLAAGDTDRAFSIVCEAAQRRYDLGDIPGVVAFVNLFPRELVTESASRMLTYALMLGLSGQLAEAHAWIQRSRARIGDEPEPRAEDVATLDVLRLFMFAVTAGAGDGIDGRRRCGIRLFRASGCWNGSGPGRAWRSAWWPVRRVTGRPPCWRRGGKPRRRANLSGG